ncbi:AGE family epimerase/isomerase [Vallicoccus soli]|uniref:AGE family epimerase/isomerase n=1 Tax=Vallicoccus soli TaxID=2339232 RepID=A0A3A3Z6C3_9ACTN|nr:AGE family epimerase/isomerase [Vallicoccus soli]RJK96245.1 AGE family epimerase/isomerase [Vallicoccus soli]
MTPWTQLPPHLRWLDEECRRLLAFGARAAHPLGGAAWLGPTGEPAVDEPVRTWITARTVHVQSLGHLLGVPGCGPRADAALAGLTGVLRDAEHGGWHPSVAADGTPEGGKAAYDHAFVVLAASSAAVAGRPGARALLDEALAVLDERFWDDAAGLCADRWDTAWTALDDYRGVNANMHAVEALMAAADATGDPRWRGRALRIATSVVGWARATSWRIPEHFDPQWRPLPEHHADQPDHPFQPYGATVGHALEWARLLLHLEAGLAAAGPAPASGDLPGGELLPAARALYAQAVEDGWHADGASGFVYTTDWDGKPVVRDRMHWVAAEAIGAAAALHRRTGEDRYAEDYRRWWDWTAEHLLDLRDGSWVHQLDATNTPTGTVWPGKPDLYHAVQATLVPRLPLAPGLAAGLRAGLLA